MRTPSGSAFCSGQHEWMALWFAATAKQGVIGTIRVGLNAYKKRREGDRQERRKKWQEGKEKKKEERGKAELS